MAQIDTTRPASPTAIPGRSRFNDTIRSLRHRNFQLFFSVQLISLIGTWMQNVAQSWLVYRLTGSSLLLGTVSFAGQIPVFPMAPLAPATKTRIDPPDSLATYQTEPIQVRQNGKRA